MVHIKRNNTKGLHESFLDPNRETDKYENIGPGWYDPKDIILSKNRNAKSVLQWKTFENRSTSIIKDIEFLNEVQSDSDDEK